MKSPVQDRSPDTGARRLKSMVAESAAKMMPRGLMRELRRYRALTKSQRRLYLKIRFSRKFGRRKPSTTVNSANGCSILFVCYGNIMRSPMCEALLKREFASAPRGRFTVVSAGINATPGRPPHPWALSAAKEFGISLETHVAQLLTTEMADRADFIFVMDYDNLIQVLSRWPGVKEKVFFLSAYANTRRASVEIADPYYFDLAGTQCCYRMLNDCTRNLGRALFAGAESALTFDYQKFD